MRYKIDFGLVFNLSICIMIFGEVWELLENRPEAIPYGDVIYHTIEVIFYILTNLAIGVSAAIVFYFMSQYIDKKKNFEKYTDFRAIVLRVLYNHMKVLSDVEEFNKLNERKEWIKDWYISTDVPIFLESFTKIDSEETKMLFKKNLMEYFLSMSDERFTKVMEEFENLAKEIDPKKEIRFFKGSKDLIEAFTAWFGYSGDFSIIVGLFKGEKDPKAKRDYAEELVNDYYSLLESSIILYEELAEFIDCIEKKRIWKFIKMLD
jgi:ABC-type multidrug transport system fused ATPase/permease subunit